MDWAYHTDDLRAATQLYNAQYDGSGPYDSGYLIEHEQPRYGLSDQQHPGSPTSDNKKPAIVSECGLIRLVWLEAADQAAFTSFSKSGCLSNTLRSLTNAKGGLVFPVS